MRKIAFSFSILLLLVAAKVSLGGFALSVDPADLNFNGAGNYSVDLQIAYSPSGLNTISGYTIRLGSPADASAGVLPSGVAINSATESLNVSGGFLFNFNNVSNSVAATGLSNTTVPTSPTTLFTLALTLGNAPSYTVGVDLDNAQRGGVLADQIASEFYSPNNLTDFTFTLNNVSAVPEPTSILTAASLGLGGMFYRRKRRPTKS